MNHGITHGMRVCRYREYNYWTLRERIAKMGEMPPAVSQTVRSVACPQKIRILLADDQLTDLARYALETIPDPSVDKALREALGKLDGRPLAGVITASACGATRWRSSP